MVNKINFKLMKKLDVIIIIISTIIKVIRGVLTKILLKESNGLIFIGKKVDITHHSHIVTGRNVKFEAYSEIQGLSGKGITLGDSVTIGRNVMIRPSSYYGTDLGEGLFVGNNSSIGPFSYIGCAGYIQIGNNVMLGPRVSLFAENHIFSEVNETIKTQGVQRKGIIIEDDCWIGSGVIILDGVTIGKGSVIGAGVLLSNDVPKYSIVIDKRQKDIRSRMEKEL
ncbi:acyltransferase [Clostridium sp. YIM B02505]|uniref:Acyltransferase n=1 Tax=Clostridium yunnanense TaxID=2800325 RepID=A0ABS1EUL0_9CLOT|nr:acyltransferase [Clostridium yunnanense]MBK1813060.1 acyltransferase [Clostridium yunnanense]